MHKIKIKKRNIYYFVLGILSFASTLLNIRYMRLNISFINIFSALCLGVSLIGGLFTFVRNYRRVCSSSWLLLVYYLFLFIVTILNASSLSEYITVIGPIICFYLLITGVKNKENLMVLLRTWCFCCFILLLLDLTSMFLFPSGLYRGDTAYYVNWFLGFKTERLYYTLPLLIIYTYIYIIEGEKKVNRNRLVLLCILILIDSIKSDGTAGTITLAVYVICIPFIGLFNIKKRNVIIRAINRLVMLFSNFYSFMAVYVFIFITVIITQSNISLINNIAKLTGKSVTFSGRLPIWIRAFNFIREHLLLGVGMIDYSQYQTITLGYNNPHNIVLTYLIAGGILGTTMLIFILFRVFRNVRTERSNLSLVLGTVVFLILGIASSSLAFCPFFFAIIVMVLNNTNLDMYFKS